MRLAVLSRLSNALIRQFIPQAFLFFQLIVHNLVLETATEILMPFSGSGIVDGWITV